MTFKFSPHKRFAARLLLVLAGCVLLPLLAFALYSKNELSEQLQLQAEQRLRHASKNAGMALFEHFLLHEEKLRELARHPEDARMSSGPLGEDLKRYFSALALLEPDGRTIPLAGNLATGPEFGPAAREHLRNGKPLLWTLDPGTGKSLLLAVAAAGNPGGDRLVLGVLRSKQLSEHLQRTLSFPGSLHLLAADGSLVSGPGNSQDFRDTLGKDKVLASSGIIEWHSGGEDYLAAYWSVFLKARFLSEDLILLVSEDRAEILQPAARFTRSFYLVFLCTTLVILLAVSILVRRSVAPLQALEEGTRRISLGQFDHRVQVDSRDEFQELAASFNAMAERLAGQFSIQTRMSQFVRAILSALDRDRVVRYALTHLEEITGCHWRSLVLFDPDAANGVLVYQGASGEVPLPETEHPIFTEEEYDALLQVREWQMEESTEGFPTLLAPGAAADCGSFLLYPMSIKGGLSGFLLLGYRRLPSAVRETGLLGRQVADQIATALSNANLMTELEDLILGTLTALARAVDAKSNWTAGHSERVTALALEIGRTMHLPAAELELLHQAGLLHDIGKIGVPEIVLDKPGRLTEQEYALIKQHPEEGARILEPIRAYKKIIPLIEQHHEWYNGQGYPHGLRGDEITLGGRILAVADVFDALISDRPYRPGMPLDRVLAILGEETGRQFDPDVVTTLLGIIKDGRYAIPAPSEIPAETA